MVGTVCRPEDVEDVPVISCSEFQWDKPLIVVIGICISISRAGGAAVRGRLHSRACSRSGKAKLRGNHGMVLAVNEAGGAERAPSLWMHRELSSCGGSGDNFGCQGSHSEVFSLCSVFGSCPAAPGLDFP